MTREKAIQYAADKLNKGLYRLDLGYLNRGLHQIVAREVDFMRVAIAALREQEGKGANVRTNADHIRNMSDEELAMFLEEVGYDSMEHRSTYWSNWLKQPFKESEH